MHVTVMFDLDNTLLDHNGASAAAVEILTRRLHQDLDFPVTGEHPVGGVWATLEKQHFARYLHGESTFQEQRRARLQGLVDLLGGPRLTTSETDAYFETYLQHYEQAWTPFEDVLPAITELITTGITIGVLTNGDEGQQRKKVQAIGVAGHLNFFVSSSSLQASKPDPHAFHAACRIAGRLPHEVVYVGDDPVTDAQAAVNAGLSAVLVDRQRATPDAWKGPRVWTLRQLAGALDHQLHRTGLAESDCGRLPRAHHAAQLDEAAAAVMTAPPGA